SLDAVAHASFELDGFIHRQQYIRPRSEFDHAIALALLHFLSDAQPANDASSDGTYDLLDAKRAAVCFFEVNPELFILNGAVGLTGIEETAPEIANRGDFAGTRDAVNVDVENAQEDTDAERAAAGEIRLVHLFDMCYAAIGGADERLLLDGDVALRIAKEKE